MTLTEIAVPRKYVRYGEAKVGDTIVEGYLIGRSSNKFNPAKPGYVFRTEDGNETVLNSCGSLDYWLKTVDMNSWVVVVYDGQEKLPAKHIFAGKEAHKFKIYSDPDKVYKGGKTAPVATPIAGANPSTDEEEMDL